MEYRCNMCALRVCIHSHLLPIASSLFNLRAWQFFAPPLSTSSLVHLLVSNHPLHTPYISSPNHCLLFATHVNTIATCFAVVARICHLFPISVSIFTLMSQIHLTILIFFPCSPGLTSMQHPTLHTTAVNK